MTRQESGAAALPGVPLMPGVRYILLECVFALLVGMAACTRQPPPTKREVLTSLADDLIVPRFQQVAHQMNDLDLALSAPCRAGGPGELEAARASWREARGPWMRSQAMWFGPVMDRRARSVVDWWPVDPDRIEKLLSERDTIATGDVREFFASTQRGQGAIEYVLFDNDPAVLEKLAATNGIRCQYLEALSNVIVEETAAIRDEWSGAGDSLDYGGYFKGTANVALLDQQAVDESVRTSVFITRSLSDMRLGKALGVDGVEPDPSAIPGGAGQNAVADLRNQVLGMQDVYLGAGTEGALGISDLLQGVSEAADRRMRERFTAALEAINRLQEPPQSTPVGNPEPALAVHKQVKEPQRALNTEVVSLPGVTVGFADTDGDAG